MAGVVQAACRKPRSLEPVPAEALAPGPERRFGVARVTDRKVVRGYDPMLLSLMLAVGVAGPRNRTSATRIPPAPQPEPPERDETPDRSRSSALKVQFHLVRRKASPHDQLVKLTGIGL
jgi:hypothetical protein